MEIAPRRSMSLDLEKLVVSPPAASSYPPSYGNCEGYTMNAEPRSEKPYRMVSSLSVDSAATKSISEPRRENFFTSVFGAITSIVVERLGKVPSSFMSNLHNSLSVTVVPNEGIISQEFFKNLTRSCEQLTSEHNNKDSIEHSKVFEKLQNKSMCDLTSSMSYIFHDDLKIIDNEQDPNSKINESAKLSKSPLISTEIFNELDVRIPSQDSAENPPETSEKTDLTLSEMDTRIESFEETLSSPKEIVSCPSRTEESPKSQETSRSLDEGRNNRWQAMWEKVVTGMSERFNAPRVISPDSELPSKKPNLSSKPSRRKTCTIARGKGRGKSQLRKNGVSQSRHRKERTKQNIYSNIEDDLIAWQNEERFGDSDDQDSSLNQRSVDQVDAAAAFESPDQPSSTLTRHCSTLFENLSFDVALQPRKRKQSLRNSTSNCPTRVRYVPECSMEVESDDSSCDIEKNCPSRLRPRLASESSVDSEDSYCIVFENGSESEQYDDYDYDEVSEEASDSASESSSDDDFDDDAKTGMTVRFNLEPQVHTMIKWDYAYRAARRGPWEEMARDRERFRGRIHCIERILTPILSGQHRDRIWENRFDVTE